MVSNVCLVTADLERKSYSLGNAVKTLGIHISRKSKERIKNLLTGPQNQSLILEIPLLDQTLTLD